MNTKTLVGALVVLALAVGGFMAVRYTRAVGERLTSSTDAGTRRESPAFASSRTLNRFPS